jgi:hypothetical protein
MLSEVKERYLEVREAGTDAVITVIEVLSPKNKRKGERRLAYETKREKVLERPSHLVEIDLLRAGLPMPMQGVKTQSDYRILVSRSERRPKADLYGFTVHEPLPDFALPLKSLSEVVSVNLQAIFQGIYQRGGYEIRIDHSKSYC